MNATLEKFYHHPEGPRPYPGQLEPSFQEQLRAAHADVTEADCHFYHTLEVPDGKVIPGGWDIRRNERNYLGHIQYDSLRVLEFGAATGYLGFWMESQGADVVAMDLPPGHPPDLVPLPGIDLAKNAASGAVTASEVRNSWWYGHREIGSKTSAVYADIYRLPGDLGRFDVSTFGSILLHLANPFKALHEAALITEKALVVTELLPQIIYGDERNSLVEFNPGNEQENLVNWWALSPSAITRMFHVLGFPHVDIHYFENAYHPYHKADVPPDIRFMFTAVGQREPKMISRTEIAAEAAEMDQKLRRQIPVINVENYNDAHRRLQKAIAQLEQIYGSLAWKLTKPLRMVLRE